MQRLKREDGPEYRLIIAPLFDDLGQKYTTGIRLETVKSFASFQYELSVKETVQDGSISLKVLGLRTPQLSLPSSGQARFTREYSDLQGTYAITVEGLDGKTSLFRVQIAPSAVKVLTRPEESFVELHTSTKGFGD